MTEEKITIHLVAVSTMQIQKYKVVKLNRTAKCMRLLQLLHACRKDVPIDSFFLYFKQFAIYPDTTIAEIIEHCPNVREIDINYSCSPQFG